MRILPLFALPLLAAALPPVPARAQAPQAAPGGTTIMVFPPGTPPGSPAPGSPTAGPAVAALPASSLRARGTFPGPFNQGSTEVTAEVLSLTRESGTLMLRLFLVNEGGANANSVAMHLALAEAHVVDPSGQRRAGVIRAAGGDVLASDMSSTGVPAGGRREVFAQFPEPPQGVTSVNLYLRGFPPIMRVPIGS